MKKVVIALGGNALGYDVADQKKNAIEAAKSIAKLIKEDYKVCICHGNGPQVGLIKKAMDVTKKRENSFPSMPFPECGAMSEGYIGYHLQNALRNELKREKIDTPVVSLITQVRVDVNDEAFKNPTKPIGEFLTKEEGDKLIAEGLTVKEDAGRGYRQVVPSPKPIEIVEGEVVKSLIDSTVVIAGGGGGIPVVDFAGELIGVDAVIDKDLTAVKLAKEIDADLLIILTAVEKVCINFGKENEQPLDEITIEEAEKYKENNEFGEGSMLPKINAAIEFTSWKDGKQTLITSLEKALDGVKGKTGTIIK